MHVICNAQGSRTPRCAPRLQVPAYPVLVEQFHNHGNVQLKCYVVDRAVHVHVKPSFPDVGLSRDGSTCWLGGIEVPCYPPFVYAFHSLHSMPKADVSSNTDGVTYDKAVVQRAAQEIGSRTGLTLFGFDLIKPHRSCGAEYLLIDVNAFPSFKGVPEAGDALRACMKQLAAKRRDTPL